MPTTAALLSIATGTAIKTLLQIKPFNPCKIVEWGVSFDNNTANTPGKVELIETDVAATVTAFVDADITKYANVGDVAAASVAGLTLSTTASGYTATAEGTITAVRTLDMQLLPPTGPYVKQFPLGREPIVQIGKFGRIRVTFGTTVNAWAYLLLDM